MTRISIWLIWMGMALALAGCNLQASTDEPPDSLPVLTDVAPVVDTGPPSWIDRPLDGSQYELGRAIPIRWHAASLSGVQLVEIRINGEVFLIAEEFDHTAQLANQEAEWNPTEAGEYLIEILSTGVDGSRGPAASKRVTVLAEGGIVEGAVFSDLNQDGDADDGGEGPLEGVDVVLVECAEKLSLVTAADGAFRFEGLPFGTDCVMDFSKTGWRTVGTVPVDIDLPIHLSPTLDPISFSVFMTPLATPTPTWTPTPTVTPTRPPTKTPTPAPPDHQAPPAPTIIGPQGGVLLGCLDDIVLRWNEVSDSSGIDTYDVALAISYNNGASWSGIGDFELEFTSLQINAQTDCGNLVPLESAGARTTPGTPDRGRPGRGSASGSIELGRASAYWGTDPRLARPLRTTQGGDHHVHRILQVACPQPKCHRGTRPGDCRLLVGVAGVADVAGRAVPAARHNAR